MKRRLPQRQDTLTPGKICRTGSVKKGGVHTWGDSGRVGGTSPREGGDREGPEKPPKQPELKRSPKRGPQRKLTPS